MSRKTDASNPAKTPSFAKLWVQNQNALGGFVCLHVPDHHLADDILQEIAELAAERFEQYDPGRPFIGWLIGIARNRIAQAYRERGRRPIVFSPEVLDAVTHAYIDMQPTEDERLDGLRACMKKLSDRHRRVIELRYARQMTSAEIAAQVACSPRAVTSMLQRIREALRKCVQQYLEAQR
ncbi:MAG: sigma-70 family RNA polymerase sigma factor [Planctomycetota bacterium]